MSFFGVLGVSVIRVSMAMWSEIPRAIDFGSLLQRPRPIYGYSNEDLSTKRWRNMKLSLTTWVNLGAHR